MNSPHAAVTVRHRRGPLRPPALRRAVVAAGAIAVIGGAALTLAGGTPALLVVATFFFCVLWAGQRTSWVSAISATTLTTLAALATVMRAYPYTGLSVGTANALVLVILSGGVLISLGRRGERLRLPDRSGVVLAATSLVAPAVALTSMMIVIVRSGGTKVSWAMGNDATFSLMIARYMTQDGGDDPRQHLHAAPLTFEVLASFIAPGRSSLDPDQLLAHDVFRVIQVLLLMLGAMSVLGAVVAAHVIPRERVVARTVISLLMGIVPWTWFVAGFALKYGFNNAVLTGVVIMAVWMAWLASRTSPVLGTAMQAVAGTVLLATWAPLVLIPLGLGGVLLASSWRAHLALRGRRLALWCLPLVLFVWYAVSATLPVFRKSSAGLGNDGAMFPSHPSDSLLMLALALAAAILVSRRRDSSWLTLGTATIGLTGILGAFYLVSQRAGNPAGPWGYYPAKYAWLLAMFAPVICVQAVASRLTEAAISGARQLTTAVAGVLLVAVAISQFPPPDLRSTSPDYLQSRLTPDWRPASMLPIVSIAQQQGMSDLDPAAKTLMRISDPTRKLFVMRYSEHMSEDGFINYWLMWQAYDQHPLVTGARAFSLADPTDPLGEACSIVKDWGGGVQILTRDRTLKWKLRATCPGLDLRVTMGPSMPAEVEQGRV